jgi:hypothetical protein
MYYRGDYFIPFGNCTTGYSIAAGIWAEGMGTHRRNISTFNFEHLLPSRNCLEGYQNPPTTSSKYSAGLPVPTDILYYLAEGCPKPLRQYREGCPITVTSQRQNFYNTLEKLTI